MGLLLWPTKVLSVSHRERSSNSQQQDKKEAINRAKEDRGTCIFYVRIGICFRDVHIIHTIKHRACAIVLLVKLQKSVLLKNRIIMLCFCLIKIRMTMKYLA